MKILDGQKSSHLGVASENDESGLTPPRFHADVEADMHELRKPNLAQAPPNASTESA